MKPQITIHTDHTKPMVGGDRFTPSIIKVEQTGFSNPICYASEFNQCGTDPSKEHYFTQQIFKDTVGWLETKTGKKFTWTGIHSVNRNEVSKDKTDPLVSNTILCEKHNNLLKYFDKAGINVNRALISFDEPVYTKDERFEIRGEDFERYLLKCICGRIAADGYLYKIPERWLQFLFHNEKLPPEWGFYFSGKYTPPPHPDVLTQDSDYILDPTDHSILAGGYRLMMGYKFYLLMDEPIYAQGAPMGPMSPELERFFNGVEIAGNRVSYRPSTITFEKDGFKKQLIFHWQLTDSNPLKI